MYFCSTIYEEKLKKHLRKCNAREKDKPVYYNKNINMVEETDPNFRDKRRLQDLTQQELENLLHKTEKAYNGMALKNLHY